MRPGLRAANLLTQALLFFFTFSLEVTVHALTQEPAGCVVTTHACAFFNDTSAPYTAKAGSSQLTLDEGASLVRLSKNQFRLLKGTVWVQANEQVEIQTEFGVIVNARRSAGDFWVSRTKTAATASAISVTVELRPRGTQETLLVAPGLKNTIGEIGFSGRAATGIPVAIVFKDQVTAWAKLYRGPKPEFESAVDAFHTQWVFATQESAHLNQALFNREIAASESLKRAETAKAEAADAETRALRALYRRKALEGL